MGFLENETPGFSKQLWNLLLSAQANPQGVPTELLEKKKEELRLQKVSTQSIPPAPAPLCLPVHSILT